MAMAMTVTIGSSGRDSGSGSGVVRMERKETKLLHGHGNDERVAMTLGDDIYGKDSTLLLYHACCVVFVSHHLPLFLHVDVIDDSRWKVKRALQTTALQDDLYAQIVALEASMASLPHAATPSTLAPSSAASAYTFTVLPPTDDNDNDNDNGNNTNNELASSTRPTSNVLTSDSSSSYASLYDETSLLDAFSVLSLTDEENRLLDARIYDASLIIPRMVFESLLTEVANDYMAEFRKKKYPITDAEHNEITRLFNDRRGQLVIDAFSIEMTTTLLQCLKPGQWLNDEVIYTTTTLC
jgi:hypothetical protein